MTIVLGRCTISTIDIRDVSVNSDVDLANSTLNATNRAIGFDLSFLTLGYHKFESQSYGILWLGRGAAVSLTFITAATVR